MTMNRDAILTALAAVLLTVIAYIIVDRTTHDDGLALTVALVVLVIVLFAGFRRG